VIYNQHVDKLNATSEQIVYEAHHNAFFYGDIQHGESHCVLGTYSPIIS
jgi:hypothetical protein